MKFLAYFLLLLMLLNQTLLAQQREQQSSNNMSGTVLYAQRITLNGVAVGTDTLTFNSRKSNFRWRLSNGKKISRKHSKPNHYHYYINIKVQNPIGRVVLYNTVSDSMSSRFRMPSYGQPFLLKEVKPDIAWQIIDSTKIIGQFTCTMAKAYFRGHDFTVWFTPQIPVPYGPWKLTGLPGLILEAYDSHHNIWFKAKEILLNKGDVTGTITMPLSGNEKVISLSQYKKIISSLRKRVARKIMRVMSKTDPKNKIRVSVSTNFMETFTDKTDSTNS